MKKFYFCLCALLGSILALQGTPYSPGGVAVDWSKYDPQTKKYQNTVNLLKNGSFEMEGTDLSGWRGKGHWIGWGHIHSSKKNAAIQKMRTVMAKTAYRRVSNQMAYAGKCSAWIKTPDTLRDMIKPLPMISNKIRQDVFLKPEKKEKLYRLVFMAKGFHTPTVPHNGAMVIQMRGQKLNAKKRLQGVGSGVQNSFKLRSEWTQYKVDLMLPANCDGVSVTLILYGVGEAYFDDVQLFPAEATEKKADPVQVRLSPYALLDNTYCVGEKLPGVMNFTFHADDKNFRRKKQQLELTLPPGFRVVDARDICKVSGGENNVWKIDLMRMGRGAFRAWYMLQACSVMIESTLPASDKTYTASYRLTDGDWKGETKQFQLKVIPAFHGTRPRMFRSSAMLGHEFSYNGPGTAKAADFYAKSGFSCIHGAKENLAYEIKKYGILRYKANYFLCNGFRLGAAEKTGNARFIMADGKHFKRKICPVEVYKRGPYYKEEVYNKILKHAIVDTDSVDIFMTNWEPYYLDSKGCFCLNCRDEFIKYSKGKPSKAEIMAVWPKELLQKYSEEYFKFRSWQHGQLVITLHKDAAALGKLKGKESGFVPEISWRSTTHGGNSYCKQYNVRDYMYELPWLEPWGPYIFNRAGLPYNYYPTAHLPTYVAAGMMKEFIIDSFKNRKKAPGMIAFPHGHQGEDWVTEPEALAFEFLCFFVRGWEGAFGYYFPRGYDYRHWRAMAQTNTLIARYENFTFKGKNDNRNIKLTGLTPLPEKLHYAPAWDEPEGEVGRAPGLSKMSPIQFQAWHLNGERLICVGNFWQKGEHFFKLQLTDLEPNKKYGVEVTGKGYGNYTGRELAKGIVLQCGALRWQFIKIGKAVREEFTQKDVKQLLRQRFNDIVKAVNWEKEYYKKVSSYAASDTPEIDFKSIKPVSKAGVTVSAADQSLAVKTNKYTLLVDPRQGGRIHDWKSGNAQFVDPSKALGFAVPGIWYPAKCAMQLKSGMKLEGLVPAADGVEVRLSRILNNKDCRELAGVKFELIHKFTADKVTSTAKVTNLLHDAIEIAFRFHNMPAILGKKGNETGMIKFASGETFRRDFDQKMIRVSPVDPLLEKAFNIVQQKRTAKKLPVRLSAPWCKSVLELTFPAVPQSIVVWDDTRQNSPTFEPVYKRTQIVPGKSAEFVMSAAVK